MVEAEFGVCEQDPDELAAGFFGAVGALGEEHVQGEKLFVIGGAGENVGDGQADGLGGCGCVVEAAYESSLTAGKEFMCDFLAVAEEQGFGHADLGVAAGGCERRGERAVLSSRDWIRFSNCSD